MEDRARTVMYYLVALVLALLFPGSLVAQEAGALVEKADLAARAFEHRRAIELYEQAIQADTELRTFLLPKLGQQYLWAGDAARAAELLAESLGTGESCSVRVDYALALSWADQLGAARRAYRSAQEQCPEQRIPAMLGEARVLRWSGRPRAAGEIYRDVIAQGAAPDQEAARIGLGNVALDRYQPRLARVVFQGILAASPGSRGAYEGLIQATSDLGLRGDALALVQQAREEGIESGALNLIEQRARMQEAPRIAPAAYAFQDEDGTTSTAAEITGILGVGRHGQAGLLLRRAQLERGAVNTASLASIFWTEQRFNAAAAIAARVGLHRFDAYDFAPLAGEANLIWTPSDYTRVDVAAARLIISDNLAALRTGLTGDFVSIGVDQRLTPEDAVSASADVTEWSAGNRRIRVRASVRHHFEGAPRITLEWPTLYQHYDEPFSFQFFSPTEYMETGPAVSAYRRMQRLWHLSGYARAGAQREEGSAWRALGTLRLSVEREMLERWGLRTELFWSNSNLIGTTGFRRTAISVQVTGRI